MRHQIKLPLFLSFYCLLFLAVPKYGSAFQLLSLAMIVMQNVSTAISMKRNKVTTFKGSMTPLSLFLIAIVPLVSLTDNVFNLELQYIGYSLLFFLVAASIYVVVSTVDFRTIFNSFLAAAVMMTLTVLATQHAMLRDTLSISYDAVNGLERFGPFNLHPNLVGHIFGGFAVMFFCVMLYERALLRKAFFGAMTGLCFIYCIAASSRGGFLAAGLGILTVYSIAVWQDRKRRQVLLLLVLGGIAVLLATKGAEKLVVYLSSIFETGTGDRGVNSGLTGRTDNWAKLLQTVFSSVSFMLFGNGLRTGSSEVLGYDIDNSYLNLLYEIGLPCTVLFVLLLVACTNRFRRAFRAMPDVVKASALGMFVFILAESMVARYLLSIGNPVSLFLLFCMLGARNILKGSYLASSAPVQRHVHHGTYVGYANYSDHGNGTAPGGRSRPLGMSAGGMVKEAQLENAQA
ncbi:O-antigen ligase family protein [Noviherbaspirillum galbum]|uniref:O-antigen ligase-related domain-containing protein n=1 Tax=Noviherbaspirillum galbum TaxID=2709383 RepID=A0A6B3SPS3_9BURK|nr:O-antigen ligase family protein [Noviherbaspirillum galbum]NEX62727.1 hypothetical protein [Noviherbaspirillum galbum]